MSNLRHLIRLSFRELRKQKPPLEISPLEISYYSQMAEGKRFAVVTGANKGIGFDVVRQLASHGITVVLTARDKKRGMDALHKLTSSVSGDLLLFHQLDVADSSSVASLADFIKDQFGRLDILVNNAGIAGGNNDAFRATPGTAREAETASQKYEWAVNCLQTNYYGAKRMIEAFIPLLQISQSPRVVNVASEIGKLKNIPNEWAKGILSDADHLTEERVDEVLNEFLKDCKEGSQDAKGWPSFFGAYTVSKAAMIAYTRVVAKKHPSIKVNSVCPGYVKTDLNSNTGILTVEQGAEKIVKLALLPDDAPSGVFFCRGEVSSFS